MLSRYLSAALGLVILVNTSSAEEPSDLERGATVGVELSGEVATEFARMCGQTRSKDIKKISTSGTIVQKFDADKYRLVVSQSIVNSDKTECLVTITAIIDSHNIDSQVTPKGTPIFVAPVATADKKAVPATLTSHETKWTLVKLTELKGVKVRMWTISEEVGQ